jgi:hypothetical protein
VSFLIEATRSGIADFSKLGAQAAHPDDLVGSGVGPKIFSQK